MCRPPPGRLPPGRRGRCWHRGGCRWCRVECCAGSRCPRGWRSAARSGRGRRTGGLSAVWRCSRRRWMWARAVRSRTVVTSDRSTGSCRLVPAWLVVAVSTASRMRSCCWPDASSSWAKERHCSMVAWGLRSATGSRVRSRVSGVHNSWEAFVRRRCTGRRMRLPGGLAAHSRKNTCGLGSVFGGLAGFI